MAGQAQWPGTEVAPQAQAQPGQPALTQIVPPTPNLPTPQAPALEQHTNIETARTQQQIDQGGTGGHNATAEMQLHQQYRADPRIQNYESILPVYRAAQTAADTPAGDLDIVTAFAKMMDPSTGVREGEAASVADAASPGQRLSGYMNYLSGGGRLPPEVRQQLLTELAHRGTAINSLYNTARGDYRSQAQRYGFDPNAIVGTHAAIPFRQQMGLDQRPQRQDHSGEDLTFWDEPVTPPEYRPHDPTPAEQAYVAQVRAMFNDPNHPATRAEIDAFSRAQGQPLYGPELDRAVQYRDRGGRGTLIGEPYHPPDQPLPHGDPNSASEAVGANIRGASDAATAGLDHPLVAAVNTYGPGGTGTFQENLGRENAYDQANHEAHPWASGAGELEGALLFPVKSAAAATAREAATAVLRAGGTRAEAVAAARVAAGRRLALEGATYGGVHGTATGEGDVSDHIANGVVEAVMGGAAGYAGRFGPGYGRTGERPRIPPLVDAETGRLNEPLESATPGGRVAAGRDMGIDMPLGSVTDRGGAIIEKGLDISPASAGVMNDSRRAVSEQATAAAENVAGRYGTARTLDDAGQAGQAGARNWIERFDAVSGKAYDAIPIAPNTPAVLNNTRAALQRLTTIFQSNPELEAAFSNNKLNTYLRAVTARIENVDTGLVDSGGRQIARQEQRGGSLSWRDLKDFRSRIGYEIGEQRFSDSPQRDELRSLYGALSEDMRATAQAQGPGALSRFERANNLYREGQDRIEGALVRILGDNSRNNPEAAAAALQTISQSGRGSANLAQLAQIRASMVKGQDWDNVASALIRLGGQPARAEGRAFNPQTFINWYSGMTEPARNLLFGGGQRQELRKALDDFVAVAQRLAGTDALRNTSQTASSRAGLGTVAGASAMTAGLLTHPIATVMALGGAGVAGAANYGLARLWTSPSFVRWATGYARLEAGASRAGSQPTAEAIQRQRRYLSRIARASPAIAGEIGNIDHRLFGSGPADSSPNP